MRISWLFLTVTSVLLLLGIVAVSRAESYYDMGDDYNEDYLTLNSLDNPQKRSSLIYVLRRACIKRGGKCDDRPADCCHNSACRCNLWGTNCKCQRMGIFQKWG